MNGPRCPRVERPRRRLCTWCIVICPGLAFSGPLSWLKPGRFHRTASLKWDSRGRVWGLGRGKYPSTHCLGPGALPGVVKKRLTVGIQFGRKRSQCQALDELLGSKAQNKADQAACVLPAVICTSNGCFCWRWKLRLQSQNTVVVVDVSLQCFTNLLTLTCV